VRTTGWGRTGVWARRAVGATVALMAATLGLSVWSSHLTDAQRNGADGPYGAAAMATAFVAAVALALWAATATSATVRLELRLSVLRWCVAMAGLVTLATATVTTGFLLWWMTVSRAVPSFIGGPDGSPVDVVVVQAGILLVLAVAGCTVGGVRSTGAVREFAGPAVSESAGTSG